MTIVSRSYAAAPFFAGPRRKVRTNNIRCCCRSRRVHRGTRAVAFHILSLFVVSTLLLVCTTPSVQAQQQKGDDNYYGQGKEEHSNLFGWCKMQMSFSDSLRDNELSKEDFVTFLYRLGYRLSNANNNNNNSTTTRRRPNFGALPSDLRDLFTQFAHTTDSDRGIPVIDVTGYQHQQPGDVVAAAAGAVSQQQQLGRLWDLCFRTTQSFVPDYDNDACKNFLALSDDDNEADNILTMTEYLNFIAHMSNDRLLPMMDEPHVSPYFAAVRGVFMSVSSVAGDGGISVNGTKTGQIPTAEQDSYLAQVCSVTSNLIAFILKSQLPGKDGSPPFPWCYENMDAVDAFPRDGTLNRIEYVTFVKHAFGGGVLSSDDDDYAQFDALPQPLQDNFEQAAGNDTAEDDGVTPVIKLIGQQCSTMEEMLALQEKCHNTWKAFHHQSSSYGLVEDNAPKQRKAKEEVSLMTVAPTTPDNNSSVLPTPPLEQSFSVDNAFYIANFLNLKQDNFHVGLDRRGLDEGYAAYIDATVSEFMLQQTWRRLLRGETLVVRSNNKQQQRQTTKRHLLVTQLSQTIPPQINDIVDSDCPDTLEGPRPTCQIVYASFHVDYENEPDPTIKQTELQEFTQGSIMGFGGKPDGLTGFIRQANPTSRIHAAGPAPLTKLLTGPVTVVTFPPSETTFPPTINWTKTTSSGGNSNKPGIVSGGAVVILVLVFLSCGLY